MALPGLPAHFRSLHEKFPENVPVAFPKTPPQIHEKVGERTEEHFTKLGRIPIQLHSAQKLPQTISQTISPNFRFPHMYQGWWGSRYKLLAVEYEYNILAGKNANSPQKSFNISLTLTCVFLSPYQLALM